MLRGLGLGGWMVQEGYMLQTIEFAGSQHVIKQKITDLIGTKNTEEFYDAYFDKDVANYDGTKFAKWNKGGAMRNDGVDIQSCSDKSTNGFNVAFIEDGEWLQYTVDVKIQSTFDVAIRYASDASGGKLYLEDENGKISETVLIQSSGGVNNWETVTLKNVVLKQGTNKVKIYFEKGNFNLNFLEFIKVKK